MLEDRWEFFKCFPQNVVNQKWKEGQIKDVCADIILTVVYLFLFELNQLGNIKLNTNTTKFLDPNFYRFKNLISMKFGHYIIN